MLVFQDDTIEKICTHAQTEYPRECCGIMLGRRVGGKRIVHRVFQTGNMIGESQAATHFLINPLEIVKAEVWAEAEEFEIVGFYHSHPDYEAVASQEDIRHMIAGYSYPIISIKNGADARVRSFEKLIQTDYDVKEEIVRKEK